MSALPFVLSLAVTSTAATASTSPPLERVVDDPEAPAPGAAKRAVFEIDEPPSPPRASERKPPVPLTRRSHHALAFKLISQHGAQLLKRTIGFEVSYAHWFGERLGADLRLAYFPSASTTFGLGEVPFSYVVANGRYTLGRGAGHVAGRWDTMLAFYALLGGGGVVRASETPFIRRDGERFVAALHGGLGLELELFGPDVSATLEMTDTYQPADGLGHDVRALAGVVIALDGEDTRIHTEPPTPRFDGWRIGVMASNTIAQYEEASPGVAAVVVVPLTSNTSFEAYVAAFPEIDLEPFDMSGLAFFGQIPDGLKGAATFGLQLDLIRARAPSPFGDAPLEMRVFGVGAIGGGWPRNAETLHVVGAVGAGFEIAFSSGLLVAVDVRDLLYEEGFDLSHLRTGLLLGWRFGS